MNLVIKKLLDEATDKTTELYDSSPARVMIRVASDIIHDLDTFEFQGDSK